MASTYGGQRQETERKVSSVVLREELLGNLPTHEPVRYVEVPVIEEVIRQVPKREVVEIVKRVPKIEYKYVDKTVEVPQVEYVDRVVEVPQIQEDIRYVDIPQVVDVPKEVIERIPRVETRVVEKIVEVPGQVIEVPKPYRVEKEITIPRYVQEEHPVLVQQTVRPEFVQSRDRVPVAVTEYSADVVEVIVPVAKIVDLPIRSRGLVDEKQYRIELDAVQYNTYLRSLNPHLTHEQLTQIPFRRVEGVAGATMAAGTGLYQSSHSGYHASTVHGGFSPVAATGTTVLPGVGASTFTGSTQWRQGGLESATSHSRVINASPTHPTAYEFSSVGMAQPSLSYPMPLGTGLQTSPLMGTPTVVKTRSRKSGSKRAKSSRR